LDWYLDNQELLKHVTSGEYLHYYDEMYSNRK
jgi:dTDP-glucose 4,6-dehydratase